MNPTRQWRARGFTLIELLVALFITTIVFTMGYGAINQALKGREALESHQDRLNEVQTTMRVLAQDFSQLAARPVRDSLGTTYLAAIVSVAGQSSVTMADNSATSLNDAAQDSAADADNAGTDMVAFTRAGWANPAGIQRPELERVSYRVVNGTLRRLHAPVLDGVEGAMPVRRDLLTHVKTVTFRFLDSSHQWTTQWPATGSASTRTRPLAVEVILELSDWGRIVRIIEVPA